MYRILSFGLLHNNTELKQGIPKPQYSLADNMELGSNKYNFQIVLFRFNSDLRVAIMPALNCTT